MIDNLNLIKPLLNFEKSGKLSVVCEDGFWRKGNVDIVCNIHNIPIYETITDWIKTL